MRLPPEDIRRMLDRNATVIILTRQPRRFKPGIFTIEDEFIARRNREHRNDGRWDLQLDPNVMSIEITAIQERTLLDLPYGVLRSAGWKTQRDFYDAWLLKYQCIKPSKLVWCAWFRPVEQPRYLHREVYRGYTSNPAQAARGEGQALSESEHQRIYGEKLSADDLDRRWKAHQARWKRKRGLAA